jgi:hypothetical protein
VFADRVETRHITQVFTTAQNVPELQLRGIYHERLSHTEFQVPPSRQDPYSPPYFETITGMDLSTLLLQQDPQKAPQGDVEVAVCDCGDLFIPVAGGFPKWPLVFLAGIPLIFLKRGEEELPPILTPTPFSIPTPTSTVPEPASLLLLLTGACALGLRLKKSISRADRKDDDV